MRIQPRTKVIKSHDVGRYAWQILKRFQNDEYVTDRIVERFGLPRDQFANARKSARHIRDCLIQAEEYYQSAKISSAATRPVQMYYCTMSLALAQIIWTLDGEYSLDRIREKHKHHGLELSAPNTGRADAEKIIAKPMKGDKGTFRLWQMSAREDSLAGRNRVNFGTFEAQGSDIILSGSDEPLRCDWIDGVSLSAVMKNLPHMKDTLSDIGIIGDLVEATVTSISNGYPPLDRTIEMMVQRPQHPEAMKSFQEGITAQADMHPDIDADEMGGGLRLRFTERGHWRMPVTFPPAISVTASKSFFHPILPYLNEAGLYYCGIYMLGMYCRYYPDLWMNELDRNSDFSFMTGRLLEVSLDRVPLSFASVLSNTVFLESE